MKDAAVTKEIRSSRLLLFVLSKASLDTFSSLSPNKEIGKTCYEQWSC